MKVIEFVYCLRDVAKSATVIGHRTIQCHHELDRLPSMETICPQVSDPCLPEVGVVSWTY